MGISKHGVSFACSFGDTLNISATVTKKHERERLIELDTHIHNQNQQLVLSGSGKVRVITSAVSSNEIPQSSSVRVAIVTGGAGGIGGAICSRLASDGFDVVVNYRHNADRANRIVDEINNAYEDGRGKALAVEADIYEVRCECIV